MPTKMVFLMVGIPGSGKSTIAKNKSAELEHDKWTTAIISRDFVRFSMMKEGQGYFDNEKAVFNEFVRQINEAMEIGIDYIFVDATHINEASRKKVLNRLLPDKDTNLVFYEAHCPVEVALVRNSKRKGLAKVPDTAIINMSKSYTDPVNDNLPKDKYGFKDIFYAYKNTGE